MLIMNQLLDSFFWVNESTPSLYDAHYSVLVFELLGVAIS